MNLHYSTTSLAAAALFRLSAGTPIGEDHTTLWVGPNCTVYIHARPEDTAARFRELADEIDRRIAALRAEAAGQQKLMDVAVSAANEIAEAVA